MKCNRLWCNYFPRLDGGRCLREERYFGSPRSQAPGDSPTRLGYHNQTLTVLSYEDLDDRKLRRIFCNRNYTSNTVSNDRVLLNNHRGPRGNSMPNAACLLCIHRRSIDLYAGGQREVVITFNVLETTLPLFHAFGCYVRWRWCRR